MPKVEQKTAGHRPVCLFLANNRKRWVSAYGMLDEGMGANLSTILPMIHFLVVVLACILTCIAAQPYPGDEAGRKSDAFDRIYADHVREPVEEVMMVAGVGRIASHAVHHCSAAQRQRLTDTCQQSVAQRA